MSGFGAGLWNLSACFFRSGLFWALVALSWAVRVGGKDALGPACPALGPASTHVQRAGAVSGG